METSLDTHPGAPGSSSEVIVPRLGRRMQTLENDLEQILLTEEEIQRRIAEAGEQIARDYAGRDLILIGVLKGASVFMADLARAIDLPLELSLIHI